jgi:chaperonin GroES
VKTKKAARKKPAFRATDRRAGQGKVSPARPRRVAVAAVKAKARPAEKERATRTTITIGGHPMANVKPLRDRVLVRRIEEAEQKVGGIIIPDTAKEKPLQAEVIAVGSGRVLDDGTKVKLDVKAGDKVLIGKWSGTEVKVDGEELLILKEDEVLGILE